MREFRVLDKEALRDRLRNSPVYGSSKQAEHLIDGCEYLLSVTIRDEVLFRNLIPLTWVLSCGERARSIQAIAKRVQEYGSLDHLVASPPHNSPQWWIRFKDICDNFCWENVGPVFITAVKGYRQNGVNHCSELKSTPTASFAILNGVHCCLAAMYLMLAGRQAFQPVSAILVLPRINY